MTARTHVPAALSLQESTQVQGALVALLGLVDRSGNVEQHFSLARKFIESGITKKQAQDLVLRTRSIDFSEENKDSLRFFIQKEFAPEQISLFIHSSPQERVGLTQKWVKKVSLQEFGSQVRDRSGPLVNVALVPGGMCVFLTIAIGFGLRNTDLVDTGLEVASVFQPLVDLSTGVTDLSKLTGAAGVIAGIGLLLKTLPDFLQDVLLDSGVEDRLKQSKRSLIGALEEAFEGRSEEGYPLLSGFASKARALSEMQAIPLPYTALLTHLQPAELVTFLVSNNETRDSILRHNPPDFSQRLDAVQGLNPGRRARFVARVRQSVSTWDRFGDGGAVNLSKTLLELRNERRSRRAAGLLPDEQAPHALPFGLPRPRP